MRGRLRRVRGLPRRALPWLVLGVVAACASVPDMDEIAGPPVFGRPLMVGAEGPISAERSRAILARLAGAPGDEGLLRRHIAIEQAVAESPLVAGNRTRILKDGPAAFRAMFAAIKAARHHVNLEYYIFEDVESGGVHLGDLLVAKLAQGVAVNIIYDSYGSGDTPAAFFDRLRKAGAKLVEFNPLDPLKAKAPYSVNDRDHRKLLIVDGATAIVGGINLSTDYQSNPIGKSGAPGNGPPPPSPGMGRSPSEAAEQAQAAGQPADWRSEVHWRDTDLEIDGPAVTQLQTLFLAHWAEQHGPALGDPDFFPAVPPQGHEVVRIIGSTPTHALPRYYVTLLSAIRTAEKSIWLWTAYFVPTHEEVEDLVHAARRGVDVRLLLPDRSDSEAAIDAGHSHYDELLEAGVKIFETHNLVLHSKTVVIDGVWSVIGSSNFDHRSVLFNDEVDAVVLGTDTGRQMQAMFEEDEAKARPINLAAWEQRPLTEKIDELLSRVVQALL